MKKGKKTLIIESMVITVIAIGIICGLKAYQNYLTNRLEAEVYEEEDATTLKNQFEVNDITENKNYVSFVEEKPYIQAEDTFTIDTLTMNGKKITSPITVKEIRETEISFVEYEEKELYEPGMEISVVLSNEEFSYNIIIANKTEEPLCFDDLELKEIKCIRDVQSYGKKSKEAFGEFQIGKTTYQEIIEKYKPTEQIGEFNDIILRYQIKGEYKKYDIELIFINQTLEGYYLHIETDGN